MIEAEHSQTAFQAPQRHKSRGRLVLLALWHRPFLRPFYSLPLLLLAALVTGLFWAKARDPFHRVYFSLRPANGNRAPAIAVLPKSPGPYPVVIFTHGSGDTLVTSGNILQSFAELGLAAVDFEYDKNSQAGFDSQMQALLELLPQEPWARTNAIAWVGNSLGAQRTLSFVLRHPECQPPFMVRFAGGRVGELGPMPADGQAPGGDILTNLHTRFLLIHGEDDHIFAPAEVRQLAELFKAHGIPVDLRMFPGQNHMFGADRPVVIRAIAENCAAFFGAVQPLQINSRPGCWYYWLPTAALLAFVLIGALARQQKLFGIAARPFPRLTRMTLWIALLLTLAAVIETAIHIILPQLAITESRIGLTRRWLVVPPLRADFDWLAGRPIWWGEPMGTLLEHVELSDYNRRLVDWRLDEELYREFVLSPIVVPDSKEPLDWRRALWEYFYPRIKQNSNPRAVARIVVRSLRERVTVVPQPTGYPGIKGIWEQEITDEAGFECISVAALRSVGIPARLGSSGRAEMFIHKKWEPTPQPFIMAFSSGRTPAP